MSTNTANAPTAAERKPITLGEVKSVHFAPGSLADAGALLEQFNSDGLGAKIIANGKWISGAEPMPDGYGVSIRPLSRRVEKTDQKGNKYKENEPFAVLVLAVPTLELLMSSKDGQDFVRDAVLRNLEQKAANVVNRADNLSDLALPFTVEHFITDNSVGATGIGLKSFTELAPGILAQLAAMKPNPIKLDKNLLRLVLSSSDFATRLMPAVPQAFWVKVLNAAIAAAQLPKHNLPTTVFEKWLAERDTVAAIAAQEFNADAEFNLA